jgi:hypothetical protein
MLGQSLVVCMSRKLMVLLQCTCIVHASEMGMATLNGQLKYTICNAHRPCHTILIILAEFNRFVVLTTRSDA